MLGLLFASLELQHGFFRAVTPCMSMPACQERSDARPDYSKYDIEPVGKGMSGMMADKSPAAQLLRKSWKQGSKFYNVRFISYKLSEADETSRSTSSPPL